MAKRYKMSRKSSQRAFSRSARYVHPKNNIGATVFRGGIRL